MLASADPAKWIYYSLAIDSTPQRNVATQRELMTSGTETIAKLMMLTSSAILEMARKADRGVEYLSSMKSSQREKSIIQVMESFIYVPRF